MKDWPAHDYEGGNPMLWTPDEQKGNESGRDATSRASRPEARVADQVGRDGFEVQVWRGGKYRSLVSFGGDRVAAMVYAEGFNAAVEWVERYAD